MSALQSYTLPRASRRTMLAAATAGVGAWFQAPGTAFAQAVPAGTPDGARTASTPAGNGARWVESNGTSLRCEFTGAQGPVVVLIHEMTSALETWDEVRRTMARLNFSVPLVATNGALSIPYQEAAGDLVVGTRGSMIGVFGESPLNPAAKQFADAYKAKFGTDRWWGADAAKPQVFMSLSVSNAYDAANILLEGMRKANSTEPQAVIRAIESIRDLRGVNALYTFTPERHHAITEKDLAIFEYAKTAGKPQLQLAKD